MSFLSTLARGALTAGGTALFGPLGGIAGNTLGGVLLGGGGSGETAADPARTPSGFSERLAPLRDALQSQALGPATESATYRSRLGEISRLMEDRQRQDAASAAARGLTGSGYEIAQAGQRGRAATDAQGAALQAAEAQQQGSRSQLLQLLSQEQTALTQQDALANQRRGQTAGMFGQLAGAVIPSALRLAFPSSP